MIRSHVNRKMLSLFKPDLRKEGDKPADLVEVHFVFGTRSKVLHMLDIRSDATGQYPINVDHRPILKHARKIGMRDLTKQRQLLYSFIHNYCSNARSHVPSDSEVT